MQSLHHLWPQVACSMGNRSTKQQITHLSSLNSIAAEWMFEAQGVVMQEWKDLRWIWRKELWLCANG